MDIYIRIYIYGYIYMDMYIFHKLITASSDRVV